MAFGHLIATADILVPRRPGPWAPVGGENGASPSRQCRLRFDMESRRSTCYPRSNQNWAMAIVLEGFDRSSSRLVSPAPRSRLALGMRTHAPVAYGERTRPNIDRRTREPFFVDGALLWLDTRMAPGLIRSDTSRG